MQCGGCGRILRDSAKFCVGCGRRVGTKNRDAHSTSEPAPAVAPANAAAETSHPAQRRKLEVPPAATGEDAAVIYKRLLAAVRGANRANDEVVAAFKRDCRSYGQRELKARVFYDRLATYFGGDMMVEHLLPQLCQLIPDAHLRKKLVKTHAKRLESGPKDSSNKENGGFRTNSAAYAPSVATTVDSEVSSYQPERGQSQEQGQAPSRLSAMRMYSDSPQCSICNEDFDRIKKRRHTCRRCGAHVCDSCSPARMLIPPEQVQSPAKDYDPSCPLRVCTICAPLLDSFQEPLNAKYANCHKSNPHQAKTRLHLPYTKSLEQECRNAADIIGNFFRPDFGANKDRSIPVAFLKRAQGLAFLTVVKAGLLISAKAGTGIVIAKLPDGSWSAPSAIGTAGISGGLEAGGEIVEFMLILGSASAIKVFYRTQVNIGGGLSLAVGPYGREANAQAAASRGGVNANYSYAHSRGLFAGVSLQGAVISCRSDINSKFYGRQIFPEEILDGQVPRPRAASCLYDAIEHAMADVATFEATGALPPPPEPTASQIRMGKDWCMHCECRHLSFKPFSKKCRSCGHVHDE